MRYFPLEINGVKELKEIYRNLSKKHHPDLGGDGKAFIEMKVEYDQLLRRFEMGHDDKSNKDLIDDLWKHCQEQGYKKGWVYFKFVDIGHDITKQDFDYLGKVLGYARGWSWHRWVEYENEKV